MRKLNLKVLLWLMGGTAVAVAAVFGIHYFQSQRIASALLWQANHAEEQEQTERLVNYLNRYLEFEPKDLEQKKRLARVLAGDYYTGQLKARRGALNILRSMPLDDEPELRRILVRVALELGANPENAKTARDTLKELGVSNETLKPPQGMEPVVWGELKGYQGWLFELEKDKDQAVKAYSIAVESAPHEQLNFQRLAWLLRDPEYTENRESEQRVENAKRADKVIDLLVEYNAEQKDAAKAHLTRWRYRRQFNLIDLEARGTPGKISLKTAMEDVAKARQREPESPEVLLVEADRLRLEDGPEKRKEARTVLERGLALQNKPGYRAASEASKFQMLWQLCNLLLDNLAEGQVAEARRSAQMEEIARQIDQVRRIRSGAGLPGAADYLEGRLRLCEERWTEARDRFERARTVLEARYRELTGQIDLYLGRCYDKLEDYGKMHQAYGRVLEWDDSSVQARLGQASARWAEGQLDEASKIFWTISNRMPAKVWLDVARLEVQRQLSRQPGQPRDWTNAGLALKAASEVDPDSAEVVLLTADKLLAQDQAAAAEKLLLEARTNTKLKRPELVHAALVELALRRKDHPLAERLLSESARLGDRVELRLAKARLLFGDKSDATKKTLKGLADGFERFTPEDQSRLLSGLAEVQFRAGDVDEARLLCETLARLPQHRTDLKLRLLLFDLALKSGKDAAIDSSLEAIAAVERNDGFFHPYAQALRLISVARKATAEAERHQALESAQRQLDRIQSTAKGAEWAPLRRARAEVYKLAGSPEKALGELKQARALGDNSAALTKELVITLIQMRRSDEAAEMTRQLSPELLAGTDLWRVAASLAARRGDTGRALELARLAGPQDAQSPEDLIWESWLLQQTNPTDKASMGRAEAKLVKAIELSPSEPEPYLAQVRFLVAQKRDPKEARAVIAQAKVKVKAEKRLLAVAQCLEAMGQQDEARAEYDKALTERSNDPTVLRAVASYRVKMGRLRDAEAPLRRLVGGKSGAPADDVAWARRGLALVLAGSNDHENLKEALALVGVTLDSNGRLPRDLKPDDNTENQRARARVLAAQPQRYFREKAIEIFEGLGAADGLSPEDAFVLALLYDAIGSWSRAKDKMQELVNKLYGSPQGLAQPQTAQYMAQYIQGLIRNKDLREARVWLGRLEALEKQRELPRGALATVELRARLLEMDGERDKALDLLREYANRVGAQPHDLVILLSAMARQKRFAEAFDLWPRVARTSPPEVASGLSVALLRSMQPKDEQVVTVEKWLKGAIEKEPDKVVLRMHLADLYDLRGRYPEAEAEYRKVLDKEPANVVALNNLAWLLAHRTGEADKALPLIETAVRGQGRRADLLDTRGVVQLALGRVDAALSDLKEATADTRTAARLFHLARAHHQARDKDNALKVLREAQALGLKPQELHPVEQQTCRQLLAEYGLQ